MKIIPFNGYKFHISIYLQTVFSDTLVIQLTTANFKVTAKKLKLSIKLYMLEIIFFVYI